MLNIRKINGFIKATYNGKDYTFSSIIDFMIAYATLQNFKNWEMRQREIEQLNIVY